MADRRRLHLALVLSICWTMGVPAGALAQSDDDLAMRYYRLGEELYNRSDYEGALRQFQQSYELSQRAPLLFNMARCKESLGQHQEAIDLYSKFLSTNPSNAKVIEARIANLRRLLAKKQPTAQDPPTQSVDSSSAPPAQSESPATTGLEDSGAATLDDDGEPAPSRPLRLTGWIVAGTGGALIITGAILGAMASGKASDLEDANQAGSEWVEVKGDEDTGKTLEKAGIATMVIGGAAVATGVVLLILDYRSARKTERAWLTPTLLPNGAYVSAGYHF